MVSNSFKGQIYFLKLGCLVRHWLIQRWFFFPSVIVFPCNFSEIHSCLKAKGFLVTFEITANPRTLQIICFFLILFLDHISHNQVKFLNLTGTSSFLTPKVRLNPYPSFNQMYTPMYSTCHSIELNRSITKKAYGIFVKPDHSDLPIGSDIH